MSSPFSTLEEFNGAIDGPTGGAIYTFANSPAINNIALIVAVGLFFWFIVKTYSTSHDLSAFDTSLNHLSSFIIAGLLSLVAADYHHPSHKEKVAQTTHPPTSELRLSQFSPRQHQSLGLLGMMALGVPALSRSGNGRKSSQRRRQPHQGTRLASTQRLADKYGRQGRSR